MPAYSVEENYKHFALKAAEQLMYDQKYIDRIKSAKFDWEIQRIMTEARHKQIDDEWDNW